MLGYVTSDSVDRKSPESLCNPISRGMFRICGSQNGSPEKFRTMPEAFRDKKREDGQSYIEFLRDKEGLLDKWCSTKDV